MKIKRRRVRWSRTESHMSDPRSRHKSTCANENGKQGLNGCHDGWRFPLADLFVRACGLPAGRLLGSFVCLITSPLRDTKARPHSTIRPQSLPDTLTGGQGQGPHAGIPPSSQSAAVLWVTGPVWMMLMVGSRSFPLMSGLLPRQPFL